MRSFVRRRLIPTLIALSVLAFATGFGLSMTGCAVRPKTEVKTVYVPVKAPMPPAVKEACQIPDPKAVETEMDFIAWLGQALMEIPDCDGKRRAAVIIHEGE